MLYSFNHGRSATITPNRKAVFFCPDCGRGEPVDGDWLTFSSREKHEYVCPACKTGFLSQPRF